MVTSKCGELDADADAKSESKSTSSLSSSASIDTGVGGLGGNNKWLFEWWEWKTPVE
jgi:hypothetical protein